MILRLHDFTGIFQGLTEIGTSRRDMSNKLCSSHPQNVPFSLYVTEIGHVYGNGVSRVIHDTVRAMRCIRSPNG